MAPGAAHAQEWRTIESSRQLRGDSAAVVRVEYAAGTLELVPTSGNLLYRMTLRYDAERSVPLSMFQGGAVTIGTRSAASGGWKSGTREANTFRAELTQRVPIRLALELGATRADIQLGGMRLTDLELRAGASEVRLDVDAPNQESLAEFDLDVGAADITLRRAGNLRAAHVRINVGAGSLDYDLDGVWDREIELSANVAVGTLKLRVPTDVGLRVTARTFLAGFERAGLVKRGDAWYSPDYDAAPRRANVRVTAVLGGFEIIRR